MLLHEILSGYYFLKNMFLMRKLFFLFWSLVCFGNSQHIHKVEVFFFHSVTTLQSGNGDIRNFKNYYSEFVSKIYKHLTFSCKEIFFSEDEGMPQMSERLISLQIGLKNISFGDETCICVLLSHCLLLWKLMVCNTGRNEVPFNVALQISPSSIS